MNDYYSLVYLVFPRLWMYDWTGEVLQRVLEEFDYCVIAESKVCLS